MRIEETQQFTLTVGLVPGYTWQGGEPGLGLRAITHHWYRLMTKEGDGSGIYPSAIVQPGVAVYRNEADQRGEPIAVVFGTRNPKYAPDSADWMTAVLRVAVDLKRALGQVTCQISFSKVEMTYYEADD
jgi:hypothetical protein